MLCRTFPPESRFSADFDTSLLQQALHDQAIAAVWQAYQSLVVPRTYRRHAAFDAACQVSAARGWPVVVRESGGGIVPQGEGIVNFSLALVLPEHSAQSIDSIYRLLCDLVAGALRSLGISSAPAAVSGSFCDGRYNLAVTTPQGVRKIAGTAQLWRRIQRADGVPPVQGVLAHAVILAQVDVAELTAQLNTFEAALGSNRRYLPERVVSLHELFAPTGSNTRQVLEHALQRSVQAMSNSGVYRG